MTSVGTLTVPSLTRNGPSSPLPPLHLLLSFCDDDLVAFAEVRLPTSVRTAPGAEAAGLQVCLALCPVTPHVTTDCQSLLTTAAAGAARATAASRPLAAIWGAISTNVDDGLPALVERNLLTWMPAHKSLPQALKARKSDGNLVTLIDWRANRLADAVARRCAYGSAVPRHTARQLKHAAEALHTEAAILGVVTYAANHHPVTTCTRTGALVTQHRRDSVRVDARPSSVPARPWRTRTPAPLPEPAAVRDGPHRVTVARPQHPARALAAAATRARMRCASAEADFALRSILTSRHSRTLPSAPSSGTDRFAAILARVVARQATAASATST